MGWTIVTPGGQYPEVLLEWAPTSLPSAESPTWVDITLRLRDWDWSYGRNDETGDFEPGTGYVLLDNRDRAFDPSYTAGPWFGNIKPHKLFRLQLRWNSVTYPGFFAYARGFPQSYPGTVDKVVRVNLTDDLATLKGVDLDAIGFNRPEERSDDRLGALLDEADIPLARRDILDGTVTVAGVESSTTTDTGTGDALNHAQQVTEGSEGSFLYVSRAGKVTPL